MSSVANEIQTAIAEQQKRYEANLLGLNASLPSNSNADSKTVSTDNAGDFANAMTKVDQSELEKPKDVRYIFPSDLATSKTNRYWTKIVPYEVHYQEGSKSYSYTRSGEKVENTYTDKAMQYQKGYVKVPGEADYKQVDCTIALPYPDSQPEWNFEADWGGDLDMSGAYGEFLDAIGAAGKDWSQRTQEIFGSALQKIRESIQPEAAEKALQKRNKRAKNSRTELMFQGVRKRSFSLSWACHPKNTNEMETLQEIIMTMKSLSLPTFNQEGMDKFTYLTFPALFTIQFMAGQDENEYMPRFGPSACTGVSFSPYGQNFYAHGDGSPISYDIKFGFQEIFPITRENLQKTNEFAWVR